MVYSVIRILTSNSFKFLIYSTRNLYLTNYSNKGYSTRDIKKWETVDQALKYLKSWPTFNNEYFIDDKLANKETNEPKKSTKKIKTLPDDACIIYTDGSHTTTPNEVFSIAYSIKSNKEKRVYGKTINPTNFKEHTSNTAELYAILNAITHAIKLGYKTIFLYSDFIKGVEYGNNIILPGQEIDFLNLFPLYKTYITKILELKAQASISLFYVKAHDGNAGNEYVDYIVSNLKSV